MAMILVSMMNRSANLSRIEHDQQERYYRRRHLGLDELTTDEMKLNVAIHACLEQTPLDLRLESARTFREQISFA
jgi:hypothetical protein